MKETASQPPPEHPEAAVITAVSPAIECGRHAVKTHEGAEFAVEADVFKDGHDELSVVLQWRARGEQEWRETPMRFLENDRWRGVFPVTSTGWLEYRVGAWGDEFLSWRQEVRKKAEAGIEDLGTEAEEGARMLEAAALRAGPPDDALLRAFADTLRQSNGRALATEAWNPSLEGLMRFHAARDLATFSPALPLWSDRVRAVCAAWYEFFPRSAAGRPDAGSTFRECLERVEDARAMGFDVIYFPPIHPIGVTKRKGRNNSLTCEPGDPGVPYAIGNRAQG
ncbi:MAG: DUF3416 domain-containing protein, partial [Terrimicrobiaceae bacterium]|nr:DUF3416 domain-containing protein [Terrimicrobiaceae bacterium]